MLPSSRAARQHKGVTDAVHAEGGKIALQILHSGRYGYHPLCVAPSRIQSPISPFIPFELSAAGIEQQIRAFVRCASLAREAGYDGVEIMGSEGYLINQFLVTHTNHRSDAWSGSYANRMRLAIEIVRRTREALGPDFIIIYRLSIIDLIPGGSSWEEVVELAKAIEKAGATLINSGIGWHESLVPTITTSVPRGAFTWVTKKLRAELRAAGLTIPVITGNRVNMPQVAEQVLADGKADMISMARPFLADPEFVNKAATGRNSEINTGIACNQACLDHAFKNKLASCLVNPRTGHEQDLVIEIATAKKRIALIGAGPAGLAAATTLAGRGHRVDLFDSADKIGGQFNMAKLVPGKEEFEETLRYFGQRARLTGVQIHLKKRVDAAQLIAGNYDDVILATGVRPRNPRIPGQDLPGVLSYVDVLLGQQPVGQRLALMGAGGIGFDVAEFLVTPTGHSTAMNLPEWLAEWGVADPSTVRGGVVRPMPTPAARQIMLLQRKPGKLSDNLRKTTGWIRRAALKMRNVDMISGVNYERILQQPGGLGFFITYGGKRTNSTVLEVDTILLCAGQEPLRELLEPLSAAGVKTHVIGGADKYAKLDAKRAIDQGTRLAARL